MAEMGRTADDGRGGCKTTICMRVIRQLTKIKHLMRQKTIFREVRQMEGQTDRHR